MCTAHLYKSTSAHLIPTFEPRVILARYIQQNLYFMTPIINAILNLVSLSSVDQMYM